MSFRFLYVDSEGREIEVSSLDAFEALVEAGEIREDTLLFDALAKDWAQAQFHPVFRLASSEEAGGAEPADDADIPAEMIDPAIPDPTEAFLEQVERERAHSSLDPGSNLSGMTITRDDVPLPEDDGPPVSVGGFSAAEPPTRDPLAPDLSDTDLSWLASVEFPSWIHGGPTAESRSRRGPLPFESGRKAALIGVLLLIGGWGIADAWTPDPIAPPDEEVLVRESRVASDAYTAEGALRIRESASAAFSDMAAGMARIQSRLDVGAPPPSWLSGEYLSNPTGAPEVLEFWEQYEVLVDSLRAAESELFRTGFVTRLQQQGITGPVLSIRLARAMRDFEADQPRRARMYDAMDELSAEARDLDEFLRGVEGRIAFAGVRSGALSNDPATEAVPLDDATRQALSRQLDELFLAMDSVTGTDPSRRRDLTGNVLTRLQGGR